MIDIAANRKISLKAETVFRIETINWVLEVPSEAYGINVGDAEN